LDIVIMGMGSSPRSNLKKYAQARPRQPDSLQTTRQYGGYDRMGP
jgi:hypothetical protein